MDCSLPGSSVHGDSPGKNLGVCCHALLQGILPTQGLNLRLFRLLASIYFYVYFNGKFGEGMTLDICLYFHHQKSGY